MDIEIFSNVRLETDRLIIRHIQEKDAQGLFAMVGDQHFCDEDGGYPAFQAMDERFMKMLHSFAKEPNRFGIALKDTDELIGLIHMMQPLCDRAVTAMEIGYGIAPKYQRQGYGYEAVSTMIDVCHDMLGIKMMLAGAFDFNTKSQRMLEKLSFVKEGVTHWACDHPAHGLTDMINYYHVK